MGCPSCAGGKFTAVMLVERGDRKEGFEMQNLQGEKEVVKGELDAI